MPEKPLRADDYQPEDRRLVKKGALTVARKLGDLMDEIVLVGGLVPSLLIDLQREEEDDEWNTTGPFERHVGTHDLDLGFAVALVDEERYREVRKKLRSSGFEQDTKQNGERTTHRWRHREEHGLKVDFLISPIEASEEGGDIRNLEDDFSAIVTPGLELAFRDYESVNLSGPSLRGAEVSKTVQVCGAGAFTVLKALAMKYRGEKDKDAYDLFYVLRNDPGGPQSVGRTISEFLESGSSEAREAVQILNEEFDSPDSGGPMDVAYFVNDDRDDTVQADVHAYVAALLDTIEDER